MFNRCEERLKPRAAFPVEKAYEPGKRGVHAAQGDRIYEMKGTRLSTLEELAERTAAGDKEAFGEIYEELLEPVYRYFYWNLASAEEAEDLTQEVFVRCLTHIAGFDRRKAAFKSWAFRIAHNLLVDHLRRRRSSHELPQELEARQTPVAEAVEEEERRRAVYGMLKELPEVQRQVIVMKYFAEMSNEEVGAVLGRSQGAVNALQHRALRKLGGLLEKRDWR